MKPRIFFCTDALRCCRVLTDIYLAITAITRAGMAAKITVEPAQPEEAMQKAPFPRHMPLQELAIAAREEL